MLKSVSKLLIGAIVLFVILAIVLGVLQMVNRSGVKRVIEDYERALCEFRFDKARACCSEDGHLIRNGKKILFSDVSAFYAAVGKQKHGTSTEIRYDTIDVVGSDAVVYARFLQSGPMREEVSCKITLKRIKNQWLITSMDDGSEIALPPENVEEIQKNDEDEGETQ